MRGCPRGQCVTYLLVELRITIVLDSGLLMEVKKVVY